VLTFKLLQGNSHGDRAAVSIPWKSFTRLFRSAGPTWLAADKGVVLALFSMTLGPSAKPGMVHMYVVIPLELGDQTLSQRYGCWIHLLSDRRLGEIGTLDVFHFPDIVLRLSPDG